MLIEEEKQKNTIKSLVVVFLTDGQNDDPIETAEAFHQLEESLNGISSQFNVIGFGEDFNVEILQNLGKAGSHLGIVSGELERAFEEIT